jgi:hypothetical protein
LVKEKAPMNIMAATIKFNQMYLEDEIAVVKKVEYPDVFHNLNRLGLKESAEYKAILEATKTKKQALESALNVNFNE